MSKSTSGEGESGREVLKKGMSGRCKAAASLGGIGRWCCYVEVRIRLRQLKGREPASEMGEP